MATLGQVSNKGPLGLQSVMLYHCTSPPYQAKTKALCFHKCKKHDFSLHSSCAEGGATYGFAVNLCGFMRVFY